MTRTIRQIRVEGKIAYVPLTKGYEAVIDAEDAPLIEGVFWQAQVCRQTVYAVGRIATGQRGYRPTVRMHRVVIAAPVGMEVDHINGNGLDNRKPNLREVTTSQNQMNTGVRRDNRSGHKGVSFFAKRGQWQATIARDGRKMHLGWFHEKDAAIAAYAKAQEALHGPYRRLQ